VRFKTDNEPRVRDGYIRESTRGHLAQGIGGDPHSGLVSFAILVGAGLLLLLGGRSETIRGLRGDGRDERFRMIDVRATAFAGLAVI
jgi:hypothetical protein